MRYQFSISAGAQEDMVRCRETDRYAAALISAFLREVAADVIACETLIDTSVAYEDGVESVEPFWHLHDARINAYRVRFVEIGNWRLITGADRKTGRVGLFGIMERWREYEKDTEYCARIERDYDDGDFPRY
jgi:hypothetical protein